jgi:signal transduction histidine kinase
LRDKALLWASSGDWAGLPRFGAFIREDHGVAEQLWRAVAAYRVVALAYAALLVVTNHDHYRRPALGWALLGVMAAWTAVTVVAYARPAGRRPVVIGCDVAISVAMVLATLAVETADRIDSGAPTLPAVWTAAPVLAAAVAGGPIWGAVSALAVGAADVIERGAMTEHTFNGIVLLVIAGAVGGYVVRLGVRAESAIDAAARREAAVAERDRLARGIHDGVLQVLALVSRRGAAIGGETAELARLAAEQEASLRALVTTPAPEIDAGGEVDLRALVEPMASERVAVAGPAAAVPLPEGTARALAAAVGEALTNVARHAGAAARAWVLMEDDGAAVTVTVRDDGAGFAGDRLAEARGAGRLGVEQSILGRIREIGGDAVITSSPGAGTEVELRVPRHR